jgi:WhiB family transcriptional regulator, redox-sensing transcriptional regulator
MTTSTVPGDWWRLAACRSAPPELFFPISASAAGETDAARAKQICRSCRVRGECLDYALQTRQVHGIWGGATENERRLLTERKRKAAARRQFSAARG